MRDKVLRVIWTLTGSTALSLLGDATFYAVLPTSYAAVGVTAMQVGWLLSINRLARIPFNLLSGRLCQRFGGRLPYVIGVGVGALSTIGYALTNGFAALLALRVVWGIAWALLVVAANTLVLQVSTPSNRGRNAGIYTPYSFFGGALGAVLGGVMVDRLGFRPAMGILGALTTVGCLLGLTLPNLAPPVQANIATTSFAWPNLRGQDRRLALVLATILLHRLFLPGVFYSTFGYYLKSRMPDGIKVGSLLLAGATLTSVLLWLKDFVTVTAGPPLGHLSDRLHDRPLVLVLCLLSGAVGMLVLACSGRIVPVILGVALVAISYGMLPPLLVAWVADFTLPDQRSGVLGVYQAIGDLGAGIGPLFAYRLVENVDIGVIYVACATLLGVLAPWILRERKRATLGKS